MKVTKRAVVVVVMGLAAAGIVGESSSVAGQPKNGKSPHVHVHPAEGPHHGSLIELGKEDYHAELVHDHAANTVTIYVLDGAAKDVVPIDARQLTLNLLVGGKPQQYRLAAQPQSSDPEGTCSAFACTSEPMSHALDAKGTTGRLNVEVMGKRFVGKLDGHTHNHAH